MKKYIILFILFIFPLSLSAEGGWFDEFRLYKKPLLKWVEIAQSDEYTELFYNRVIIKRYKNAEYPTELYTHSPDEDPDCYNSLQNPAPSTRAKNIIGRDFLRACLVLETKLLKNRYILFYWPSVDGNRVSLYDIRTKKFSHALMNNVLDVRTTLAGGIVFVTKSFGTSCQKKIILYKDGVSRTMFDECSLQSTGWPLIHIDSYRIFPRYMIVSYTPYVTEADGDIILDPSKKSTKTINF